MKYETRLILLVLLVGMIFAYFSVMPFVVLEIAVVGSIIIHLYAKYIDLITGKKD